MFIIPQGIAEMQFMAVLAGFLFGPESQAGHTGCPVYRSGRHLPGFKVHGPASPRELFVPGYKIMDAVKAVDFIFFHRR